MHVKRLLLPLLLVLYLHGLLSAEPWRFAVLDDTHVPDSDTIMDKHNYNGENAPYTPKCVPRDTTWIRYR